jgi:integrase
MATRRRNGKGTFRKNRSKANPGWSLIVRRGGAIKTYHGTTKEECLKKKAAFEQRSREKVALSKNSKTSFSSIYKSWMEKEIRPYVAEASYFRYVQYSESMYSFFGDMSVAEIDRETLKDFCRKCSKEQKAPEYSRAIHHLLNAFFRYLNRNKYIPNAIEFTQRKYPIVSKGREDMRAMTKDEAKMFLYAAKNCVIYNNQRTANVYYLLFVFALETGMRHGEILALQYGDIDFNRRIIHVKASAKRYYNSEKRKSVLHYRENLKTKSSLRDIPINNTCMEVIQKTILINEKHEPENFLFQKDRCGKPLPIKYTIEIVKRVDEAVKLVYGIDLTWVTFHTLRHTFAVNWMLATASPDKIAAGDDMEGALPFLQKLLGHSSFKTTEMYLTIAKQNSSQFEQALKSGIQRLNNGAFLSEEEEKRLSELERRLA